MATQKRTALKRTPPPPPVFQKEGLMGSVVSGFGMGTGLEAARSLFGGWRSQPDKSPTPEGCQTLAEILESCQETHMDCEHLTEMFSKKCMEK